eukprot:scaffold491921_cov23-Prasinocladus_malaysianus.AAC.1
MHVELYPGAALRVPYAISRKYQNALHVSVVKSIKRQMRIKLSSFLAGRITRRASEICSTIVSGIVDKHLIST